MDETPTARAMATLPWSTDLRSLTAEAATCDDGAACSFVINSDIPIAARAGYAALVVAYTRDGEPVTIFDDGSALLLVRDGGLISGRVAAERILAQMTKLGLAATLRVGVVSIDHQPDSLARRARAAAESAAPGSVAS